MLKELKNFFLNRKLKVATHIGDIVINGECITGRPLTIVYENYYIDLITDRACVLVNQITSRTDIIQVINIEPINQKIK